MVAPGTRAEKIIYKFIDILQRHIKVERVYLFGSFARGRGSKYSDIDLAIISPDFAKLDPFDRLVFLGKVAWEAGTPVIEAIGYTPKEFATKSPIEFPTEIKTNGVPIKIKKAA